MASQVLSGASNPTYTNNTGQNVRVVINFMSNVTSINWAGVSASSSSATIGRNLAFSNREASSISGTPGSVSQPGAGFGDFTQIAVSGTSVSIALGLAAKDCLVSGTADCALPTELMLASGQTFSATCGAYNIVVIPEAG